MPNPNKSETTRIINPDFKQFKIVFYVKKIYISYKLKTKNIFKKLCVIKLLLT